MNKTLKNLIYAAACLALCILLPFLTGNNQQLGNILCLMHIPVLLCGFLCGPWWGLAVGAIAPLLRSVTVGMPPLFPTAVAMAFELAVYGLLTGLLHRAFPKKPIFVYVTLILAMLAGRLMSGAVQFAFLGLFKTPYSVQMFLTRSFATPWPGILLHIAIIPPILFALKEAGLFDDGKTA
ncbi:MAG: ECF transporter S component [Clostridia bacterium]|nr:ECF transporter S component [Clostridia bacterium]